MSMIKWGFTMIVNIGHPRSRGRLTLKNANPGSEPNIDLNLLDHADDLKDMRNAFKVTQDILHGSPLKDMIAKPLYPKRYLNTDAEIDDYLRAEVNHAYHPVGTCKMGRDDMAVVDARLKVKGLANVRVADASIMPEIINGNTNATCIMIGGKSRRHD
jgi:choline dehydrogenase-like flavoprotein